MLKRGLWWTAIALFGLGSFLIAFWWLIWIFERMGCCQITADLFVTRISWPVSVECPPAISILVPPVTAWVLFILVGKIYRDKLASSGSKV
jgi:hypothetical protein